MVHFVHFVSLLSALLLVLAFEAAEAVVFGEAPGGRRALLAMDSDNAYGDLSSTTVANFDSPGSVMALQLKTSDGMDGSLVFVPGYRGGRGVRLQCNDTVISSDSTAQPYMLEVTPTKMFSMATNAWNTVVLKMRTSRPAGYLASVKHCNSAGLECVEAVCLIAIKSTWQTVVLPSMRASVSGRLFTYAIQLGTAQVDDNIDIDEAGVYVCPSSGIKRNGQPCTPASTCSVSTPVLPPPSPPPPGSATGQSGAGTTVPACDNRMYRPYDGNGPAQQDPYVNLLGQNWYSDDDVNACWKNVPSDEINRGIGAQWFNCTAGSGEARTGNWGVSFELKRVCCHTCIWDRTRGFGDLFPFLSDCDPCVAERFKAYRAADVDVSKKVTLSTFVNPKKCPEGWLYIDTYGGAKIDKCYYRSTDKTVVSWLMPGSQQKTADAAAICKELGGALLKVESYVEADFLTKTVMFLNGGGGDAATGLVKLAGNNYYQWAADGTPFQEGDPCPYCWNFKPWAGPHNPIETTDVCSKWLPHEDTDFPNPDNPTIRAKPWKQWSCQGFDNYICERSPLTATV